jgi:hypothetical protein
MRGEHNREATCALGGRSRAEPQGVWRLERGLPTLPHALQVPPAPLLHGQPQLDRDPHHRRVGQHVAAALDAPHGHSGRRGLGRLWKTVSAWYAHFHKTGVVRAYLGERDTEQLQGGFCRQGPASEAGTRHPRRHQHVQSFVHVYPLHEDLPGKSAPERILDGVGSRDGSR